MGSSGSKSTKLIDQLNFFSKEEQENVSKIFEKINQRNPFQLVHWQMYLGKTMTTEFSKGLFAAMLHQSAQKSDFVDYSAFVSAMASFLKGYARDLAPIFLLLATDGMEIASYKELHNFVRVLINLHLEVIVCKKEFDSWNNQLRKGIGDGFVDLLLKDVNSETKLNVLDIETWLSRTPLLLDLWNTICQHYLPISTMDLGFPFCTNKMLLQNTMLDLSSVFLLNHHLPAICKTQWNQLFNSATDGQSFSILVNKITAKGQTLVIIKDKGGNVFGAFANVPWEMNANFRGGHECFLFSLIPNMAIYRSTGYDGHFMYLNQNQQTLPNGLGFGGQLNYFGIWLDAEFGIGHCSPSCVTYSCPQLSSTADFDILALEVWRVGPELEIEQERDVRSIIDKDVEAKAMLKMMDRGPVSEGFREEEPTACNSEEKEMIPEYPF